MLSLLQAEAEQVRAAIDRARRPDSPGSLEGFPVECCDHAARLMAFRLLDVGLGQSTMVNRNGRGPFVGRNHVWIVHHGVLIDLAADQFGDEPHPKVIVANSSPWHVTRWSLDPRNDRPIDAAFREEFYQRCPQFKSEYLAILESH